MKIVSTIIASKDFVEEELELVKRTEQTLARKYRFVIRGHNIVFYGLCENCCQKKGGLA